MNLEALLIIVCCVAITHAIRSLFSSSKILGLSVRGYRCGQANEKPSTDGHVRFEHERLQMSVIQERAKSFFDFLTQRRSVRFFDPNASVPLSVIEDCVRTAGTAPSGAHCQPWMFCVVQSDQMKAQIREIVEKEEYTNYQKRMGAKWVDECLPLVSGLPDPWIKPYLTEAQYLIVVMKKVNDIAPDGSRIDVRYPVESVGISVGLLLAALHNANLVTLTSTPMSAGTTIRETLGRPDHEKVFLLLPVGFPAKSATVPARAPEASQVEDQLRKDLNKIMSIH